MRGRLSLHAALSALSMKLCKHAPPMRRVAQHSWQGLAPVCMLCMACRLGGGEKPETKPSILGYVVSLPAAQAWVQRRLRADG